MSTRRIHSALLALAAGFVLAGCGGGGGGDEPAAPSTATAGQSSGGFLAFIASFDGGMFDNSEPFDLSGFDAPTNDTESDAPVSTPVDQ